MSGGGLTPTGFVVETVEDIVSDIETDERTDLGSDVDTSAESLLGGLNATMATQLGKLWEQLGVVYNARAPRNATFQSLKDLCAITGTIPRTATQGRVVLLVTLNAGITLPAGSRAAVSGQPQNLWQTTEAVTNTGGTPASFSVPARAVGTGVIVANAGLITVKATPVSGWTAVTNPLDAAPGLPIETDAQLRTRREVELSTVGTGPIPAIYADLARVTVDDVRVVASITVQENASAYYDALHRPPNSIEAVVQFTPGLAGDDLIAAQQAVADQLWASKAGGIGTFGNVSMTVIDDGGNPRTVQFSTPTEINVWISMLLSVDPAIYDDASSNAATKQVIVDYGDLLRLGRDVIRARLISVLMAIVGVVDVIELDIGTTAGSVHALNLAIGPRELAAFDTSRVAVVTQVASEP